MGAAVGAAATGNSVVAAASRLHRLAAVCAWTPRALRIAGTDATGSVLLAMGVA